MNKRGDTPVWTIIVFGIIAIVVLVLAVTFLGNTSTAGGEKVGRLFGLIELPERVEPKYGNSIIGNSCSASSECVAGLACINSKCTQAQSYDLTVSGKNNCAKDNTAFSPHSARNGKDWCIPTQEGFTYQVEYNDGAIIDKKGSPSLSSPYVMLEINTNIGGIPDISPPLLKGLTPYEQSRGDKIPVSEEGLTYLAPYSIHTFKGGPFVCGWYRDTNNCNNNEGAVLVRAYQWPNILEESG